MTEKLIVDIKFLTKDAVLPEYAHPGKDAGLDLVSSESTSIAPGERKMVSTGIALDIPEGWVGLIHPRSGLAIKKGLTVLNTPGTIDSGYQGEIKVILINLGGDHVIVHKGERIAQMVFQQFGYAMLNPVGSFVSQSDRGAGGFGSTGK